MIELAAISVVGLIVALLLAAVVYFIAAWIGAPQVVAALLAVLVFILAFFGGVSLQ